MRKDDFVFRYRVQNWPAYNRALVDRGRLTFWFDEAAISAWCHTDTAHGRGRPRIYADAAIQCALILKSVFHLNLRATQGLLSSVIELMALELPVPDYTTLCRRQGRLAMPRLGNGSHGARHVIVDSTGLKVYGPGEWYVRKHRPLQRRTWRKLHIGVDETTKEIVAVEITTSRIHDCRVFPDVLSQVTDEIAQVSGDGAYDTIDCYDAVLARDAIPTLMPRRNAKPRASPNEPTKRRNAVLQDIAMLGRYEWRVHSGATRQSLAENAVSRWKTMLGSRLTARGTDNQSTEAMIKATVLNRMASLGMPESIRVVL